MQNVLIIVHVVIAVILIISVLFQHGAQQGLSGAIAGGAETFFGKNKGRTIDAVLNKITTAVAILFVVSAIVLTVVSVNESNATEEAAATEAVEVDPNAVVDPEAVDVAPMYTIDAEGNLLDAAGTVIADSEALENEENFNENGDLLKPGTDEVLVPATEFMAALEAAAAEESVEGEATEGEATEGEAAEGEAAEEATSQE